MNRQTVDRPATAADLSNAFQNTTVELTKRSEVPVVAKEARVVGEVTVGKTATERVETITDTVRKTDVQVEELKATDATTSRI